MNELIDALTKLLERGLLVEPVIYENGAQAFRIRLATLPEDAAQSDDTEVVVRRSW